MSAAEFQRINATTDSIRERIERANEERELGDDHAGSATIVPFPASHRAGFIARELQSVRDYDGASAFRYLISVVRKHRSRLEKLGISRERIDADVRALEAAFGLTF